MMQQQQKRGVKVQTPKFLKIDFSVWEKLMQLKKERHYKNISCLIQDLIEREKEE